MKMNLTNLQYPRILNVKKMRLGFFLSSQFQNESVKNSLLCSHFNEMVENKCSGNRQRLFEKQPGNQILNFKAIWFPLQEF